MPTIAKNTKRAALILSDEQKLPCRSYNLRNYFVGEPCDVRYAREALHNSTHAKLTTNHKGGYTVHVHSNQWYEVGVDA